MTFEEFKDLIKDNILNYLPTSYSECTVELTHIMKNNSLEMDGLSIRKPEAIISPNIYLNKYFENYNEGRDLEDILEEIAALRIEHEKESIGILTDDIKNFDSIKDKLTCRIVSGERNAQLFENVAHTRIYDLGITYHIDLLNNDIGTGSIRIMNSLMKEWNKSVEDIHDIALANTIKNYPVEFTSITEVIMGMMKDEILGDFLSEVGGDEAEFMKKELISSKTGEDAMYVLTNSSKLNGATVILYPDVLKQIGEKLGKDYYILPSSLHELIVVPKSDFTKVSELEIMIKEVNSTQVLPDEVLADHPYEFSRELEKLTPVYSDDHFKVIVSAEGFEDKLVKVPKNENSQAKQRAMER